MSTAIERNEIFDLAFRFVTETSENIFLTGKAGTGKTTFLKYLKEHTTKNMVVAAPTGVAAINAGGVTLHSLFQLPLHPFLPTKLNKEELLGKLRYNRQRQLLLRKMELLVIDEISMVRCDVLDAVDTILRSIRRNFEAPFGGVQLLCIGDMHQLPPVAQQQEWSILQEYYSSPFFFDSLAIKEQTPLLIELTTIYRQKEGSFVRLLNKVRNNYMDADDFEDLNMRYNPLFSPVPGEKYITLTSHNKLANEINQQKIESLLTPTHSYKALIEGEFPENIYPAEADLVLKVGAQVMFLKNDIVYKKYFNGKIGVITTLEKDRIVVECDGEEIEVGKESWENARYTLNRNDGKLEQEVLGTFSQYPLRLAWAITIHKSQGLTFDKVMIDAGSSFSPGQVYVALSRCTSLEGIVLLSKLSPAVLYSNENVIRGEQSLTHKGSLPDRFAGARFVFTQQLLADLFSFAQAEKDIDTLLFYVHQQKDKLNEGCVEWIEKIRQEFAIDKAVGVKFIRVLDGILKEELIIENNIAAQKRISDAANHFEPKLTLLLKSIQNHPLVTEHKETAGIINEQLVQLCLSLYSAVYYLQYCKQPFSVTSFLQHKLNFSTPKFQVSCYGGSTRQNDSDVPNAPLFATLKRWRDMILEEEGQAIYMVANLSTLKEIATYLPLNKKDLLKISGFGKAKVDKYGDAIIDAVESYCNENGLSTNIDALPEKPGKAEKPKSSVSKTDTKLVSYNLYKEGKSIAEIAQERKLTMSTIEGHLVPFISSRQININDLVDGQKQKLILDAVAIHGELSHKTLIENLPSGISYGELKLVLASRGFEQK
ncbi:MAG: helix-turn-helix domain-containing protein [Bacteroidetes bacterium]|nr:helix-turn-helix domain-containing protein [Bacteroidota bacterium]